MEPHSGNDVVFRSSRMARITKSDSVRSHKSINTLGAFPLGNLRVHDPGDSPMREEVDDDEDSEDGGLPPPLAPPGEFAPPFDKEEGDLSEDKSPTSESARIRRRLTHDLGGGDVVLILDLPELFTVGYDSVSFTAKHFGGVKDIPPGPHFFWAAHPGGSSARCGFWIFSTGLDTVHVLQWDKFNEVIAQPSQAEARIQADDLGAFHSKLVPYPDPSAVNSNQGSLTQSASDRHMSMWKQLTGSISEGLLTRVTGQRFNGSWMVHTGDRVTGSILNAAEILMEKAVSNPSLQTRELHFTFDQGSKTYSTAQIGAERTQLATDSTKYIQSQMAPWNKNFTHDEIVGEFQFAFVIGVHLGNDSCIQQWWYMLLQLFLRAYSLPTSDPILTSKFFHCLNAQLSYSCSWLDGSILDHADSPTRKLRLSLTVYKRRLDELLLEKNSSASPDELAVVTAFSGVEATVADKLDWDLRGDYLRRGNVMMEDGEEVELEVTDLEADDERGEWAPTMVDLDETGRERDRFVWND
ncbi:AAR2 protein-domain-containing protein [Thelonectria olida]|uniref:AAR2 protein-domain-containing protein n=1 Tax=Thelonectria olida TaxID=1576542 RepID=A0A9P8WCX5_9HYPO|nr:AAR2 protein-domain-containing protein [Thelonectria olida]